MKERKNNVFGLISLIIGSICFFVNLGLFLPMLSEQIKTGFGAGTDIEMGALIVWLINGITIIPLIICVVFTVISVIKSDYKWKIITNISLIALTVVMMVLTTVFMFI